MKLRHMELLWGISSNSNTEAVYGSSNKALHVLLQHVKRSPSLWLYKLASQCPPSPLSLLTIGVGNALSSAHTNREEDNTNQLCTHMHI